MGTPCMRYRQQNLALLSHEFVRALWCAVSIVALCAAEVYRAQTAGRRRAVQRSQQLPTVRRQVRVGMHQYTAWQVTNADCFSQACMQTKCVPVLHVCVCGCRERDVLRSQLQREEEAHADLRVQATERAALAEHEIRQLQDRVRDLEQQLVGSESIAR